MQHFVSTMVDWEDNPVIPENTIKKLTRQMLKYWIFEPEDTTIDTARTVAEMYEAAAIAYGYEPPEPPDDIITVKEAMSHLVSAALDAHEELDDPEVPEHTIKKLTKQLAKYSYISDAAQYLDRIDDARTISEIYEICAEANGYGAEPVPSGDDNMAKIYIDEAGNHTFSINYDLLSPDVFRERVSSVDPVGFIYGMLVDTPPTPSDMSFYVGSNGEYTEILWDTCEYQENTQDSSASCVAIYNSEDMSARGIMWYSSQLFVMP